MPGDVIRAYREARNWSQRGLARRANLPQSYISLLERGKRHGTLETYQALAQAFEVPFEELMKAIGEQLPPRADLPRELPPPLAWLMERIGQDLNAEEWSEIAVYAQMRAARLRELKAEPNYAFGHSEPEVTEPQQERTA